MNASTRAAYAALFAASLAALRRFALYGAGSEKAQPIFVDCALEE